MVTAVASTAIAATRAYFSETKVLGNNTFATATVMLSNKTNLPLTFSNLIPGEERSQDVGIKYGGTVNADIYVGVADGGTDPKYKTLFDPNLNRGTSYAQMAIWDNASSNWVKGWTDVGHYFGNWTKVATNVNPNSWSNYTVHFRLKSNVGNDFQNIVNINNVVLYTVQTGAPAPTTPEPWRYHYGSTITPTPIQW
ncbi:MAG: hypothetical protein ACOX6N_05500 [Patescibacteria group bacterium]|jgi:hypothetical protein